MPRQPAAPSVAQPGPPPAPACTLVIFGARGDLTKRLLVPALYNLARAGLLDDGFKVLGVDHNPGDDAGYRAQLAAFMQSLAKDKTSEAAEGAIDPKTWSWLEQRLFYLVGDFEQTETYRTLGARLREMADGAGQGVLFYLATSARFFGDVVDQLAKAGLTKERGRAFRRVVIEKPFGDDLASGKALNRRILASLSEPQIYRIDHFLGKETVRNIMALRFGNAIFEPIWNRQHIDHVQITAAETVGVEGRGAFYDQTGALRDMTPNHLFQLLGMVAMEAPNAFDADAVRAEKTRVIEAITVQTKAQALANSVRGQYRAGTVDGRAVAAYRDSDNVAARSRTETYVALKLEIDNWRWAGVPFYLRTGKAMAARDTEIAIQFKDVPGGLFQQASGGAPSPNKLILQIQPREGIAFTFDAKRPGPDVRLAPVRMDFCYADYFAVTPATGYETLIYDCLIGDQTLFKKADEIDFSWRAVQPFLDAWATAGEVHGYPAGANGPRQAELWMERQGRRWRPVGG